MRGTFTKSKAEPWTNPLGVLWVAEPPTPPRWPPASRSVRFAIAPRATAAVLLVATLAPLAAVPAANAGVDPVIKIPLTSGRTGGEDEVPAGGAGAEDEPEAPVAPEPAASTPRPEPAAPEPTPVAPAPTPEPAAPAPAPTPEPAAPEATPEPPPAVPEATPEATTTPEPAVEAPAPEVPAAPAEPVAAAHDAATAAPESDEFNFEPLESAPPVVKTTERARSDRKARVHTPTAKTAPAVTRPVVTHPAQSPAPAVSAPAAGPKRAAAAKLPSAGHYTTRSGDSLWTIAERILGPGASERRVARLTLAIWERNKVRIGTHDPDILPAGITITLLKEAR